MGAAGGAAGGTASHIMSSRMLTRWFAETHSSSFELRRHFFRRFFDSELISDPGQAKVVAGGALAIAVSLSLVFAQAYYHKYNLLDHLPDAGPYHRAILADMLFVISLAMTIVALFTTLEWPSLFPGLRDYLALAALPLRMRELFVAKFTALLAFMSLAIVSTTALPSLVFPAVMSGAYGTHMLRQVPGIFVSASMAGFFVFFTLVTVQGVLLNILPVRQFSRVSLALQGALLGVFLCALPLVFSIPDLYPYMELRPAWAMWVPPLWFLGVDQVIAGNPEPLALRLTQLAFASVAVSAVTAILVYLWSYRRHRTRVIESPGIEGTTSQKPWTAAAAGRFLPDLRSLAVFGFIAKSLARSRQHRLILTAFAAIALAVICEGFASLVLEGGAFPSRFDAYRGVPPGRDRRSSGAVFIHAGGAAVSVPAARRAARELGFPHPRARQRARTAGRSRELRPVLGRDSRGAADAAGRDHAAGSASRIASLAPMSAGFAHPDGTAAASVREDPVHLVLLSRPGPLDPHGTQILAGRPPSTLAP